MLTASLVLGIIGSFLGIILSCIKIRDFYKKPKLKIKKIEKSIVSSSNLKDDPSELYNIIRLVVENIKKEAALKCVGILTIDKKPEKDISNLKEEIPLHWPDTEPKHFVCSTEPITIYKVLPRPLNIVFTYNKQEAEGAWIATHFSIKTKNESILSQFYMPPGKYEATIKVECNNGKGDEKRYRITSPKKWDNLHIEEI